MKPSLTQHTRRLIVVLPLIISVASLFLVLSVTCSIGEQNARKRSANDEVFIHQIPPEKEGGRAYKLVYYVNVPIDFYWKFKTDFQNDFLVTNKYIREHNFISQNDDTVITEEKYTNAPDVYFRWQTTVFPEAHRLDFVLLNPEQCGQKYHYGHIQLESVAEITRVTQVAFFDFWGASLWTNYPWRGGMRDFLSYTAHWEQKLILHLKDRYEDVNPK